MRIIFYPVFLSWGLVGQKFCQFLHLFISICENVKNYVRRFIFFHVWKKINLVWWKKNFLLEKKNKSLGFTQEKTVSLQISKLKALNKDCLGKKCFTLVVKITIQIRLEKKTTKNFTCSSGFPLYNGWRLNHRNWIHDKVN